MLEMKKDEKIELGSGNAFRDFGYANADAERLRAILAAEIVKILNRQKLTVCAAHARTGIAAADFSRIRNADLSRFTLDRLFTNKCFAFNNCACGSSTENRDVGVRGATNLPTSTPWPVSSNKSRSHSSPRHFEVEN